MQNAVKNAVARADLTKRATCHTFRHSFATHLLEGGYYISEQSVEIVTFAEQNGEVIPFAFIYGILEKESKSNDVYNIRCKNQLGVVSTGTIDLRDKLKPKMALTTDKGITFTNISNRGRKMKKEFLPRVDLGR